MYSLKPLSTLFDQQKQHKRGPVMKGGYEPQEVTEKYGGKKNHQVLDLYIKSIPSCKASHPLPRAPHFLDSWDVWRPDMHQHRVYAFPGLLCLKCYHRSGTIEETPCTIKKIVIKVPIWQHLLATNSHKCSLDMRKHWVTPKEGTIECTPCAALGHPKRRYHRVYFLCREENIRI